MKEELIDKVARALATIDNNLYWKYDQFPKEHVTQTEKWYKRMAEQYITVFDILWESKNE